MSEHSNRIHSALVGAKLGKEKGLKLDKLYDYARDFVGRSQFVYSKATRPQIGRGVKAPVFVFKSYVLNYANFLKYLYGKDKLALTTAVATFLALSGLKGIPGYNVMRNAVTWAMRKAGLVDDEENMKKKVKEFEDSIDKNTAGMILHGVPSVVGIEGSWTFGAPELFDLVPVTMYEMGKRFYAGLGKKGLDITERMGRIAPTELKKLIRLYQMKVQKKMATDIYGKPKLTEEDIKHMPKEIREYATKVWQELPTDMDTLESILFGLGFPTRTYGKYQQDVYDVKQIA